MGIKLGILIFLLCLIGCDFTKKNTPKIKQKIEAHQNTAEVSSDENSDRLCPSGEQAELIKGDCSGVWEVGQSEGSTSCDFKWGPTIECPSGSEGLEYKSVCYGTTSKPMKASSITPKDCENKFGKYPISPKYELWCCSK